MKLSSPPASGNTSQRLASLFVCVLLILACKDLHADQPIFDEMPRWDDGWGVQLLHELRTESALLDGQDVAAQDLTETIHLLHLEGVYTWTKSVRLTLKLPVIIHATRTLPDAETGQRTEQDRGLGNPTLTLPLKSYFNLDGRSGSFTLAPDIVIPGGTEDNYNVFDRRLGAGLSIGYETETYRYHFGTSATGRAYLGDKPATLALNLSLGFNIHALGSSGHLKWKTTALTESDGSFTLSAGPTLYWRFTDTVHGQLQWKHDFIDRQGTLDHGRGESFRTGIGLVF